jgi:hypothetical protein
MKKQALFAFLLVWVGALTLTGQMLDRGNFMIGLTIGFSTADSKVSYQSSNIDEEGEGPSAIQFSVAPKVGYFLADNFVLGIGMDYTFSSVKNPNEDRTDDSDLLFGPYGRYYLPLGEDMAFFLEANFGFGNSSDEQVIGEHTQRLNTNIFAVGLGPGFTIFSNQDLGIEALFKYNFARSKFDTKLNGVNTTTTTKTNAFDVGIGLSFYFGGVRRAGG